MDLFPDLFVSVEVVSSTSLSVNPGLNNFLKGATLICLRLGLELTFEFFQSS